jgi:hypothetical protein
MLYRDHAMLIQTPNGQDILIDGGPDTQKVKLELGETLPFWDRTNGTLTLVFYEGCLSYLIGVFF